jgi:hypothetical protein
MAVDLWNLLENKRLVYCWKVGTKTGRESHRDSGLVQQQGSCFGRGKSKYEYSKKLSCQDVILKKSIQELARPHGH